MREGHPGSGFPVVFRFLLFFSILAASFLGSDARATIDTLCASNENPDVNENIMGLRDPWCWGLTAAGQSCPAYPGPDFIGENAICPEEPPPDFEENKDVPVFIFVSGICSADTQQTQESLWNYWSQYRNEGIPDLGPMDFWETAYSEYQYYDNTVPRGGELGQILLQESVVGGEAVYYRTPWACRTGVNAGAYEVAKQIRSIMDAEWGEDPPGNPPSLTWHLVKVLGSRSM